MNSSGRQPRLAFVVQRFGEQITGGSESLARAVALRFLPDYQISIFTSCATDYVTWKNDLPPGRSEDQGLEVRRFLSEQERDLAAFNQLSDRLYGQAHSEADEQDWLRQQGPFVPSLIEELARDQDEFDAIFFFTYLYYPTYWGLKAVRQRAILVPTAHDEPPLKFGIYRDVFARPAAFGFCSGPEAELVKSRFPLHGRLAVVAGMGIENAVVGEPSEFAARHGITRPYALYAGRIDPGKGCAEMFQHFVRYRTTYPDGIDLVLVGNLAMELPAIPGVHFLGFVSEADKMAAMAGATVVICPGAYESLSIVLLEAMSVETPVLANAASAVLKDHCVQSNAGLFYEDGKEFVECLRLLREDAALNHALGEAGRRYVDVNFRWGAVLRRYRALISVASAQRGPAPL